MNTEDYILIGELTDSLEWCYEQLEEVDSEDARIISELLTKANKIIEKGY